MCGSNDLLKQDGVFVCQHCGCKYSIEEAKKMMIEGTVDVSGSTVKVDNVSLVEGYLENARRARRKENWAEAEKYYDLVEQYSPQNIEAIFYSSYCQFRETIMEGLSDRFIRAAEVLKKTVSVIDDYYDAESENIPFELISAIVDDIYLLAHAQENKLNKGQVAYMEIKFRADKIVPELIDTMNNIMKKRSLAGKDNSDFVRLIAKFNSAETKSGCYVATAVYGSYDCPQVWTLRRFRDYTLAETWYGRAFIRTYYAISPTLVKWFGDTDWFKKMWKGKLDRMVANLNAAGVEDTPYEDKRW